MLLRSIRVSKASKVKRPRHPQLPVSSVSTPGFQTYDSLLLAWYSPTQHQITQRHSPHFPIFPARDSGGCSGTAQKGRAARLPHDGYLSECCQAAEVPDIGPTEVEAMCPEELYLPNALFGHDPTDTIDAFGFHRCPLPHRCLETAVMRSTHPMTALEYTDVE